jgi:hypothetical protein
VARATTGMCKFESSSQPVGSLWAMSDFAKILATFPRVSEMSRSLRSVIFWIFRRNRRISLASLWSRIFNIRVAPSETRFEVTRDRFDTRGHANLLYNPREDEHAAKPTQRGSIDT